MRLRDKGIASEVVVATIAPADAQAHLRNGLAMGANRAIHVVTDQAIQPLTASRTLLKLIEKEQPDLVILGKQAIDDDANQTGQMLATLWGRPQATFASKLEIADGKATVTREVDAGLETLEVDLPAVVTTDLRLNEPRFIKLPDIMKAKAKPLETLQLADLGVEAADTFKTTQYAAPSKRSKGVMVRTRPNWLPHSSRRGCCNEQDSRHRRAPRRQAQRRHRQDRQCRRRHQRCQHRRAGAGRRPGRRRRRSREDRWRRQGPDRGQCRQRAGHRPGTGTADRAAGQGLYPCVRPVDHLRQGPHAVRGRPARRQPSLRPDERRRQPHLQAPDLRRQRDHHRGSTGRPDRSRHRARRVVAGSCPGRQRRHRSSQR